MDSRTTSEFQGEIWRPDILGKNFVAATKFVVGRRNFVASCHEILRAGLTRHGPADRIYTRI